MKRLLLDYVDPSHPNAAVATTALAVTSWLPNISVTLSLIASSLSCVIGCIALYDRFVKTKKPD